MHPPYTGRKLSAGVHFYDNDVAIFDLELGRDDNATAPSRLNRREHVDWHIFHEDGRIDLIALPESAEPERVGRALLRCGLETEDEHALEFWVDHFNDAGFAIDDATLDAEHSEWIVRLVRIVLEHEVAEEVAFSQRLFQHSEEDVASGIQGVETHIDRRRGHEYSRKCAERTEKFLHSQYALRSSR